MNDLQKHLSTYLLATAALFVGVSSACAQTAPALGTSSNFAALGGTGVTCTSPNPPLPAVTISGGNVGSLLPANSSVTGFPGFTPGALPCSLSGTVQLAATRAFADFLTAYNTLAGITCPADAAHNLVGDLGGMVLSPGVYCISGVGLLTSKLTLAGPSTGIWIFKAASSLTPIAGSVVMANGSNACNVYWQLGTAASFVNTQFAGNILAGTAITFNGAASSLVGRALAKTDVTMTGASISLGNCGTAGPPSCKGKECDRDDDDKDKDKDRDKDKDKEHGSDHSPFGSNDDHDDKSGRKDGDR